MSFLSYSFLLLLPIATVIHRLLPSVRMKNLFLLIVSVAFYGSNGIGCIIVFLLSAGITYTGGLLMAKTTGRKRKTVFAVFLILNLSILLIIKYTEFLIDSANQLLGLIHAGPLPVPRILQPIGLSFIIFQSSTYLFDLKSGKTTAERNLIRYTLFVSFFPTLVCGPIQRAALFLPQLKNRKAPAFKEVQSAVVLFMWGYFLKRVIADRIAICTDLVFDDYLQYDGAILFGSMLMYNLQIYLDFAGYSCMAIGTAALFGFRIKDNFSQPYFAGKITDFWRRWHISLTSWFTDYVYIPLGGNRKGALKRYINILVVFLISGLWHGAGWNFLIWGMLHAIYQVVGYLTAPSREKILKKCGIDPQSMAHRLFQRVIIFFLVSGAWVFFRSSTVVQAVAYLRGTFFNLHAGVLFDGSLFRIGLKLADWNVLVVCFVTVLAVSGILEREKRKNPENPCAALSVLNQQSILSKTVFILLLFTAILIFGIYGEGYLPGSFIYAGF